MASYKLALITIKACISMEPMASYTLSHEYKGMYQYGTSDQLQAGSEECKGIYQQGTSGLLILALKCIKGCTSRE